MKKLEARMKNQELSKNYSRRFNDFIGSFELYPDGMMTSMYMDKEDLEDLRYVQILCLPDDKILGLPKLKALILQTTN